MGVSKFTLMIGIVFIVIGIIGIFPGLLQSIQISDPDLVVKYGYGRVFGLFPVNIILNLVHLGLGVWAVMVYKTAAKSAYFCRFNAIFYAVLAIMGLIPGLNTVFGLVPLFSNNVWLHAVIAAATAYYGYVPARSEADRRVHA